MFPYEDRKTFAVRLSGIYENQQHYLGSYANIVFIKSVYSLLVYLVVLNVLLNYALFGQ